MLVLIHRSKTKSIGDFKKNRTPLNQQLGY